MSNDHPTDPDRHPSSQPSPETPSSAAEFGDEAPPATGPAADAALAATDLERLQQEVQAANDRALRWQAELENYRKRARRELDDERRYAALPLLEDLLGVVDNLQRAVEAAEGTDQANGLREGVKMVAAQMTGVLAKHHCQPIESLGQPFDPHWHEAIAEIPHDEYAPGHVALVARQGYRLHDRVVRPSQVLVSKGPAPRDPDQASE